jgi:hypothetical protein
LAISGSLVAVPVTYVNAKPEGYCVSSGNTFTLDPDIEIAERVCPMGTDRPYAQRMPRAKWTPDEELDQEIGRLVEMYRKLDEAEAACRAELKRLARPEGRVPIAYLAERLNVERKTVYRHLGRSMS